MAPRTAAIGVVLLLAFFWVAMIVAGSSTRATHTAATTSVRWRRSGPSGHAWDACARLCWLCIRADVGPCQAVLTHSRYCATPCRCWVHHRLVCADEMHRRRCVLRSGQPAEHRSREHARVHSRRRGDRFDVTPRRRDDRIWNRVASTRTASRWHRLTPGRGATVVTFALVSGDSPGTEQRIWVVVMMLWTLGVAVWSIRRATDTSSPLAAT